MAQDELPFDGASYKPDRDSIRLSGQLAAVKSCLIDHPNREWTLPELRETVKSIVGKNASESSISARIRDLRKEKFGGYEIQSRYVTEGLWTYWYDPCA